MALLVVVTRWRSVDLLIVVTLLGAVLAAAIVLNTPLTQDTRSRSR